MRLTSVGKNEVRIHDCLGRGRSGTFLVTPFRVRSQVRPLGLHTHVLPAILAVEGSPGARPVRRQPVRAETGQKYEVKVSEALVGLAPGFTSSSAYSASCRPLNRCPLRPWLSQRDRSSCIMTAATQSARPTGIVCTFNIPDI